MAYEKRELSGSTFKNKNKQAETHADYTGDCLIDGQEYWINTWVKTMKDGTKFFSHSFRKKQPRGESQQTQTKQIEISDDMPF